MFTCGEACVMFEVTFYALEKDGLLAQNQQVLGAIQSSDRSFIKLYCCVNPHCCITVLSNKIN